MNGFSVIVIVCYNIAFAFFLPDLVGSSTKLTALPTATTTTDDEEDEANMVDCSTQPCHPPCPSDSVLTEDGECCLMSKCLSEVASKCDASQCQKMESCPADSYPIEVTVSADGCCSLHQGCQCLPKCDSVTCPSTTIPVIELEPTGEPGRCCPLYRCDHGPTAELRNPELSDFASCITNDHGLVKHNFSWSTQDSCVRCTCQDGMVHCITPTCKPCPKWTVLPSRGQCCPECEDYYEPEDCFPSLNCTEVCLYGNEIDEDGCVTCKCKRECPEDCIHVLEKITISYGINGKLDDRCVCDDSVVAMCSPLVNCNRSCHFGFKKNGNGCDICECVSCTKHCPNGYVSNDKETGYFCKCKGDRISISSDYDATANPILPVYSYENTTSKTKDCTKHQCEDGNTVCFEQLCLQSCSAGNDACCPICPGYRAQPRSMITVLLTVVVSVIFIIFVICTAQHCRYRRQQVALREFSRGSPYYQYVPAGLFNVAQPQKVQIHSADKRSVALV